jgi:hypothetical protein
MNGMPNKKEKTAKKLTASILIIFLLGLCLVITTAALVYSMVSVDDNLFQAQTVQINLNDGQPVIREDEYIFEPGMTVKKDFFVQNESTCDVYYRLYFKNVSGGLANVLQVKICDGDKVLFEGTPAQLNRTNVAAADDLLHVDEKRNLQIYFHYPEEAGNDTQMQYLTFDFAADATQVRNNTNKVFE